MRTAGTRTLLATVAAAALLAAAAAQVQRLPLLGESYFALLALFFAVGIGTAWVAVRVRARATARRPGGERTASAPRRRRRRRTPEEAREIGTVKWFDRNKGYGFVVRANGDEIFVHNRHIRRHGGDRYAIGDGQRVSFVAVKRERGWQAEDVEDASAPAARDPAR